MLYYRKSVLNKAGVEPPTTLVALTDAASKVADRRHGRVLRRQQRRHRGARPDAHLAAGTSRSTTTGPGSVSTTKPGTAPSPPRPAVRSGRLLKSASADWSAADPFVNGKTAMQWSGLWSLPDIAAKLGDDFGVLPFPRIGSGAGRRCRSGRSERPCRRRAPTRRRPRRS